MGIRELLRWLRAAPPGTTISAAALVDILEGDEPQESAPPPALSASVELTWRERVWLVPAETRLTIRDVCEALGHSRSWLYRHLADTEGAQRIPHRKLDGELVFVAGELRAWLRSAEDPVAGGPMESTPEERMLSLVRGATA